MTSASNTNLASKADDLPPLHELLGHGVIRSAHTAGEPFERTAADLLHDSAHDNPNMPLASLVGVPFDTTTMRRRGAKHGPAPIRQAFAALLPCHAGYDADLSHSGGFVDYGDVQVLDTDVETTWTRISTVVRALASHKRLLVVLGGDHGLTFPVIRGLSQAREGSIALISLDAHFDVRPSHRGQPASGVPFRYCLERLEGACSPRRARRSAPPVGRT